MKLPELEIRNEPLSLDENTKTSLIALYLEMISVRDLERDFDQNDCTICVIGHGLRDGMFTITGGVDTPQSDFQLAVDTMSFSFDKATDQRYKEFLFGPTPRIIEMSQILQLQSSWTGWFNPQRRQMSVEDALVRIAAVLDRAGESEIVKQLPEVNRDC